MIELIRTLFRRRAPARARAGGDWVVAAIARTRATPDEIQFLEDRIHEFNAARTGFEGGEWLALTIRDASGHVAAGLCGALWGGCLEIRQLWVDESGRGRGVGTRLLAVAEREAARHGCRQILLSTFSFQAPGFYLRRGFEVLAEIQDHPTGHSNFLLRKRLATGAAAPEVRSAAIEAR